MGYAYSAKAATATPDTVPTGWPPHWTFPPTNGEDGPWPPGWPIDGDGADYALSVIVDDEFSYNAPLGVTARILDGGVDTDDLNLHAIQVTATKDGAAVQIKKESGDSFADFVTFTAGNYTGSRYGFDDSILVDLESSDAGAAVSVTCEVISITPTFGDSDSATVGEFAWTARSASEANQWYSVDWSPTIPLFAAVSQTGTNRIMTSPTGLTWTPIGAPAVHTWYQVLWVSELSLFVAVGQGGGTDRVMTSADGVTWAARTNSGSHFSVAWSPSLGILTTVESYSTNGTAWSASSNPGGSYTGICWSASLGYFLAVSNVADGSGNYGATSLDGINWVTLDGPPHINISSAIRVEELGKFFLVSQNGQKIYSSPTGVTWTDVTPFAGAWTRLIYSAEREILVAVGTSVSATSVDGVNWTSVPVPESNAYFGIAYSPSLNRFVSVAASGTSRAMTGE